MQDGSGTLDSRGRDGDKSNDCLEPTRFRACPRPETNGLVNENARLDALHYGASYIRTDEISGMLCDILWKKACPSHLAKSKIIAGHWTIGEMKGVRGKDEFLGSCRFKISVDGSHVRETRKAGSFNKVHLW